MTMRLIHGAILASEGIVADVLLEDGTIVAVGQRIVAPASSVVTRADGYILWPGWIDQHIHGVGGVPVCVDGDDTVEHCIERMSKIASILPKFGVTGFFPTSVAQPTQNLAVMLRALRSLAVRPPPGARLLGLNLEGMYLSPEANGAHDRRYLVTPAEIGLDALQELGEGQLPAMITVAPEIVGALDFIAAAANRGVVVAIGHTVADAGCVADALLAGAKYAAHFGNAMGTFHQRAPGAMGALLANDSASLEIIPNRALLHPTVWQLVWRAVGPERILLVSDGMPSTGAKTDKRYRFGGTEVEERDDAVYRTTDRRVWGNATPYNMTLAEFMRTLSLSSLDVAACVSRNQCIMHGLQRLGRIQAGHGADLVITNRAMNVIETLVRGETVFGPVKPLADSH